MLRTRVVFFDHETSYEMQLSRFKRKGELLAYRVVAVCGRAMWQDFFTRFCSESNLRLNYIALSTISMTTIAQLPRDRPRRVQETDHAGIGTRVCGAPPCLAEA